MKIVMVNDYQDNIGGTETYMYTLIKELEKKGHEVILFTSDVTSQEYFSPGYNKSFFKYVLRLFNFFYFWKFRKFIKETNPDVIHIHNIYNEITPSILLFLNHHAVLMTVHGSQMVSPVSLQTERTGKPCKNPICEGCTNCIGWKGSMYELIKRFVYRLLLHKVKLYIAPSNYLKSVLEQKKYTPVIRIYNGIHLFSYEKLIHSQNLLYVGRLTTEKGVLVLIDAFKKVIKKIPDAQLMIVGKGYLKEEIENKIQKTQLEKHISFAETVNADSMKTFYAEATVVIIPSIYPDNLPTVGLEALSVGRPVIGSRIGGIPEIIKHNETGVIIDPNNTNQLATGIITLLSSRKSLEKMSKNARKFAETNFDIRSHVTQILKQYENIMTSI